MVARRTIRPHPLSVTQHVLLSLGTVFSTLLHLSVPSFLMSLNNIPSYGHTTACLSVHLLMGICVFTLWQLWIQVPWTLVWSNIRVLLEHLFSVLLEICLGVELLGPMITLCLTYQATLLLVFDVGYLKIINGVFSRDRKKSSFFLKIEVFTLLRTSG